MKKAWTLAELTIALVLILIIVGIGVRVFRPDTQKSRIFMYATLKNMNKVHSAIMEKYGNVALDDNDGDDDWYCVHFMDEITTSGVADCDKDANIDDVNVRFPNGVTIQGLANEWKTPYEGSAYTMKNMIIDIDGEKGANKVWVDRFPIRVLKGDKYTGTIRLVDCSDDVIYDTSDKKVTLTDNTGLSPYCKQKFNVSGGAVTKGINKTYKNANSKKVNENLVTYDVYRATSSDGPSKATLVASAMSPMDSDCMSYGGDGAYNREQCAIEKIKIAYKCATADFCSKCDETEAGISICPVDPDNNDTQTNKESCVTVAEKYNPLNLPCFTLLHKPNMGMSLMINAIIGSDIEQ